MHIYIAGPMRGQPGYNFPAFNDAASWLRQKGHAVYNPAELEGNHDAAGNPVPFTPENSRKALAIELAWIARNADAIYMLVGWENSLGARAEHATAVALGILVLYQGGIEDFHYAEEAHQ